MSMGLQTNFVRTDSFQEMLDLVTGRQADGAIANISITAERETVWRRHADVGVRAPPPAIL